MIKATIAGKSVTGEALIIIAHQKKGVLVNTFGELIATDVVNTLLALLSAAKQAYHEKPAVYEQIVQTVIERIKDNGNQINH